MNTADEENTVESSENDRLNTGSPGAPPEIKRPCIESRLLQGNIDNQINDNPSYDDSDGENEDDDVANPNIIQEAIRRRLAGTTNRIRFLAAK